ncbi:MAG: hypothetical protein KatS3mg111_3376 [Pirellulaceae bacterium]|nr:MAG: hypothetical protein KatS3mg111_3376 [Pirellulaceae bacterium]
MIGDKELWEERHRGHRRHAWPVEATVLPILTIMCLVTMPCCPTQAADPSPPATRADASLSRRGWTKVGQYPLRPARVVVVPAVERGMISEILVEEDMPVEEGQILARLDASVAQSELQVAASQLASAKVMAEDTSDVDHQRLVLQELQAELENHLAIGGSVSQSEIRSRRLSVDKAEVALHHAQRALEQARLNLELAQARYNVALLRLQRHTVRAKVPGVVSRILKHAGEWVEVGEPLAEIKDLRKLRLDWIVPLGQCDLTALPGKPVVAEVVTADGRHRLDGHIIHYDHQVSAQGLVRIHVELDNSRQGEHWRFLPGMTVELLVPADLDQKDFDQKDF